MNNMKKTLFATALTLLLALTALCSCSKEGTELFEGYYSYKLSGEITLTEIVESEGDGTGDADSQTEGDQTGDTGSDTEEAAEPQVLTLTLTPESGQMNILTRDKDGGKMVITLNAMGGDATTLEASVEDGKLVIPASDKYFSSELLKFKLSISGEGSKLSDMVLMDLTAAETEISYLGKNYTLTDSKITCVATSNDR
jgi:hypothetical protein